MKTLEGYIKGINLGGWLSQCVHTKEHYDTFLQEEDVKRASEFGIDHLRVPIDYDLVEDKEGNFKEDGFAYIQRAIDWCKKYNLKMILDLHKTAGYSFDAGEKEDGFFDNEEYQERFYRRWEEFARRFACNEQMLAFELLNEVTKESYCSLWNQIAAQCIRRIRKIAPTIKILVGGYNNNSVLTVKYMDAPQDENIVYNFHCYEPLIFTHQGAYWIETMDKQFRMKFDSKFGYYKEASKQYLLDEQICFPNKIDDDETVGENYFEMLFEEAIATAEERDVALYCGEYGVINLASPEDTVKWYRAIHAVFERHGIGRAAWSYQAMDFGLVDEHLDTVREELAKLL
ncbi:MAG: cellulase family glycosylhydrolase [bacterium]|nr:cellulase family glycosylhydrolase [bacterium]